MSAHVSNLKRVPPTVALAIVCVAWASGAARHGQPPSATPAPLPLAYTYTYIYCPDFYTGECLNVGTSVVTPGPQSPGRTESSPSWSPDASEIAIASNGDIAVMNAATGALVNITNTASQEWSPAWSPDGQRIAFWSDRSGPFEVYVMDPDGSNVVPVTTDSGTQTGSRLSWSPDSARLAYTCTVDPGNDDVCTINVDGTGFLRLTTDPGRDASPAWSPDGGTIAFATDRNGEPQLATMSPDGSGEAVIGGGVSGWDPAWSPDGRQIAFTAVDYSGTFGFGLYTMLADGSGVSLVASDASEPAWMPTLPFASFSVVCTALTCTVDATGSIGNITGYVWDFGDQTTGSGGVVSHTYAAGGNFTVTLTVTDDGGATSASQEIVFLNQPPVAAFTVSCDQALTCVFDGSSSSDPTGPIIRVQWWFGDGSYSDCGGAGSSICLVPSHVYALAGTYTATLQVDDPYGESSATSRTFSIVASPASPVHVGDLDGTRSTKSGPWSATVTIEVHQGNHVPIANAVVISTWSTGATASCTTNAAGRCSVSRSGLAPGKAASLSVTGVTHPKFPYSAAGNHDPDGDSNGTTFSFPKR